jgi:two-component SAPR family response regulator
MRDEGVAGCRILVVEDEAMIALAIEDTLEELGCEVVGSTGKLETALRLAKEESLDAAILDVSIRDQKVYPVAEQLLARGIPFVLASGYCDWALPNNLRDQPRLTKPFTTEELTKQITSLCQRTSGARRA